MISIETTFKNRIKVIQRDSDADEYRSLELNPTSLATKLPPDLVEEGRHLCHTFLTATAGPVSASAAEGNGSATVE
mgnify:CR=1 FL=1|jgi:hypothetical protein